MSPDTQQAGFDGWLVDGGEKVGMVSITALDDREPSALLDGLRAGDIEVVDR